MEDDEYCYDSVNIPRNENARPIVIGKNCIILPPDHPEFLHCFSSEAPRYADTLELVVCEI